MSDFGLIFDVDGVIADTEAVNARASIRAFRERLGVENVAREDFAAGLGRGAEAYVRAAADVHGIDLRDDQVEALTQARQENFLAILKHEPLPAFPGVLPLMEAALRDTRWAVAIATSSTRAKSEAVLRAAKIPYERMVYVSGSDVSRKKPDPELFLTAARRLGLDARTCLVIEDAPNGVAAAHAAGCACIAVTNSAPADALEDADRVVASLSEVSLGELQTLADRKAL